MIHLSFQRKKNPVSAAVALGLAFMSPPVVQAMDIIPDPTPAPYEDTYNALSSNGTFIGGYTQSGGKRQAMLWTSDFQRQWKLHSLNDNPDDGTTEVTAISSSGSVVAGHATDNNGRQHAVIWTDNYWGRIVDLDEDTSPAKSKGSTVNALDDAGNIAGGYTTFIARGKTYELATLWIGNGVWDEKITLNALGDRPADARVQALSADGAVVGGWAQNINGKQRAVIWHGDNWEQIEELGHMKDDDPGRSRVNVISADGHIAGGVEITLNPYHEQAVLWHGDKWKEETRLDTLLPDNQGSSTVMAMSADGKLVAGSAAASTRLDPVTGLPQQHAIIWSGDNWKTKTDLGVLREDKTGNSAVYSLSSDGRVAIGKSTADDGNMHSVIWKLYYPDDGITQANSHPLTVKMLDATHTIGAVQSVAKDSFNVMEMQRHSLGNLMQGCSAQEGKACWSVQSGFTSTEGDNDTTAGLSLAYGLTEHFSAGFTLDHSFARTLRGSFHNEGNNIGAGLFTQWHTAMDNNEFYLRPAVSFSQYDVEIRRPTLSNTESGRGSSTLKGWAASLEGGQIVSVNKKMNTGWHFGLRHSDVRLAGFEEQGIDFPVTYNDINYKTNSAYAGADLSLSVTDNINWLFGAEAEQALGDNNSTFNAGVHYIGSVTKKSNPERTTGSIKTGVEYEFGNDVSLSIIPEINRTALGETSWGLGAGLTGYF